MRNDEKSQIIKDFYTWTLSPHKLFSLIIHNKQVILFMEFQQFGKILIFTGIFILILGIIFFFGDKIPFIGRLPGDIIIKKKNFIFYFPIVTSLILSLIVSLIIYFIKK